MPRKKKQPENTADIPVRRRRTLPKPEIDEVDDSLPVEIVEDTPGVTEEEQDTHETSLDTPEVTDREPETQEDELDALDNQPDPEFVESLAEPDEEAPSTPELKGEIPYDIQIPADPPAFHDPLEGPAKPKYTKYTRYTRRTTWKGADRYGDAR